MVGSKLNVFHNLSNYMSTMGENSCCLLGIQECLFYSASFPLPLTFPQVNLYVRMCQAEPSRARGYIQEPDRSNIQAYVLLYSFFLTIVCYSQSCLQRLVVPPARIHTIINSKHQHSSIVT